ncbi:Alg9-like mannosyltransferase family-domain-containing protein [Entophlyctis helioformis]|nr:Alg9-like mannosyltransferase family-domain-containing protein [Entophlyctis helioformis]
MADHAPKGRSYGHQGGRSYQGCHHAYDDGDHHHHHHGDAALYRPRADVDNASLLGRIPVAAWALLLLAAVLLHLAAAPFSKVEESFNSQAAHDLIFHGPLALDAFDHKQFPGAVPRTFLGPLALWLASLPVALPVLHMPALRLEPLLLPRTKIAFQYLVRGLVAVAFVASTTTLLAAVRRVHGRIVGAWFAVFSLVQFHTVFWASRTLPNVFALILFNLALAAWLRSSLQPLADLRAARQAAHEARLPTTRPSCPPASIRPCCTMLGLLALAATAFRIELVIPSALMVLSDVYEAKAYALPHAVGYGLSAFSACLTIATTVDSLFWGKMWMWAEGHSFYFNVVQNKAEAWGVSPFHTYFTALLPRIAPLSYLFAFITWRFARQSIFRYWRVVFGFVAIYSLLGHKEWRFVVYVVPVLNILSAIGMAYMYERAAGPAPAAGPANGESGKEGEEDEAVPAGKRSGSGKGKAKPVSKVVPKAKSAAKTSSDVSPSTASIIIRVMKIASVSMLVVSGGMLQASSLNYPGGVAFARLHDLIAESHATVPPLERCSIHIDTFAAMTGVTRFGEASSQFPVACTYAKTETHTTPGEYVDAGYTYLLTAKPHFHLNETLGGEPQWQVIEAVHGYAGLTFTPPQEWMERTVQQVLGGRVHEVRLPVVPVTTPQVYILARLTGE